MRTTKFLDRFAHTLSRICRRPMLWLVVLAVIAAAGRARAEKAGYQLAVTTDRPGAVYEVGEDAKFLVDVTRAGKPVVEGNITFVVDDFLPADLSAADYPKGKLKLGDQPACVSVTAKKPTFLRCRVTFRTPKGDTLGATVGAGFSPLSIGPSLPVPDDFDAFWKAQKEQLAKVPPSAKLTTVDQADTNVACFDVRVDCAGGAPVSGYLALPKGAEAKSLPAVLWVHGAGVRGSSLPNATKGAHAGMLSMDINAHGIPNGKPAAFYRELADGRLKNYRHDGRDSRDTIYFRGMFLRLVRAIDFLASRPEWNGRVLAVVGHSQGGGQALAAGGLDPRVTFIASGVPAICDHSGRAAGRINGWPKLVPTADDGQPDPVALDASRYVDAVNFASRCRADAVMSVGFVDTVCPPSSCYAAYNLLKGRKEVTNEPHMAHAAPPHIHELFFDRLQRHVKESAKSPAGSP